MNCRMIDLRSKEVINVADGSRLGCVCDVEINTEGARLLSVIIYGRLRFFGLFGREDDMVIPWEDVQMIGDDTILVHYTAPNKTKKSCNILGKLFREDAG